MAGHRDAFLYADWRASIHPVVIEGHVMKLSYAILVTQDVSGEYGIIKKNEKWSVDIDLSRIERIDVLLGDYYGVIAKNASDGATFPAYIRFAMAQGENGIRQVLNGKETLVNQVDVPFGAYQLEAPPNLRKSQLFKAINHLRKLSGAPEPLSFD